MDEYDVFMDQKTRSKTLDLLKTEAECPLHQHKQFIVLTPQQLNSVQTTNMVRIHSLKAPERITAAGLNQQTLN